MHYNTNGCKHMNTATVGQYLQLLICD